MISVFVFAVDPVDHLGDDIAEMADIVKEEFNDNNKLPAEVGRKEAAYRGCYGRDLGVAPSE